MPPATGKRKRGDRAFSGDQNHEGQRPSPHHPGNLNLAQQSHGPPHEHNHNHNQDRGRGRGGRRFSRGRGGYQQQSPTTSLQSGPPPPISTANSTQNANEPTQDAARKQLEPVTRPITPSPPPQNLPAFDYEYITANMSEQWSKNGQQDFIALASTALKDSDYVRLSALLQELCRSVLDARLPPDEAGEAVKEVLKTQGWDNDASMSNSDRVHDTPTEAQTLFLDTVTIVTDDDASHPYLPLFIASTDIPLQVLREELEAPLLQKIGLIRDTFARMGIRKQTNLLYRQANFNLLREESEGFAKLMTELFTTSDSEPPTGEVVKDTVQRVKAMIGAFDLDVGRTLDVVLDVFGAVLVKQYRFFVKFLRLSPWWPRDENYDRVGHLISDVGGLPHWAAPGFLGFNMTDEQRLASQTLAEQRDAAFWRRAREVGLQAFFEVSRPPMNGEQKERLLSQIGGADRGDALTDWIEKTNTIPPKGNRDAAQLLGFKLRFYSSSPARNTHDVLPDNLIYLSALLIKIGFISLKDLYPHVWRSDAEMDTLKAEKEKEKEERERAARPGASARNALLMAGALVDDTQPLPNRLRDVAERAATPSKENEKTVTPETKDSLPEPADQKVPLLKSLLAIGALPESLFILGKFPWMLDLYPDLLDFLHRIIHHSINKIYDSTRPLSDRESLRVPKRVVDNDVPGIPKGQIRLAAPSSRRTLRWAQLDREDAGVEGTDYRFYWDDWSDCVPVCQSIDDMFTLFSTFGALSNVKIGHDTSLLFKLARIGVQSLSRDESKANKSRWLKLCRRLLIPALSLTKANPGIVNEVFGLLRRYPIDTRYAIYSEWFSSSNHPNPDVKFAFNLAKAETRDTLKRLSKTNIRPIARTLAKIACANPHVVTTVAINQIEAYDNLAEVFVEGARYFTDLGYDVLTWCLINSLSRAGRSRVQESGLLTSKWLGALAYFASRAFKRYSVLDPTPVLQYVADQLKKGNSTDLILLEQVILSMAGIVTDTNYNESQILAMGGGELLQSQTVLQLLDKRHESKTTSRRLIKSLKSSGLAGQLLLSIAQERRTCVFKMEDSNAPLKILGNLFDEIHRVLTQFLDLLRTNISLEEFKTLIPDAVGLIVEYGIQPEIAFWISRPTIIRQMTEVDKEQREAERQKIEDASTDVRDDTEMTNGVDPVDRDEGGAEAEGSKGASTESADDQDHNSSSITSQRASPVSQSGEKFQWHPVLQGIMDALQSSVPGEVSDVIGLPFYVAFWQLALYDILIPGKAYEDEISRQNKQIVLIGGNRADVSVAATRKKEEEKKRLQELSDRLLAENRQHLKAYGECKNRLLKEKDHWFKPVQNNVEVLNTALMEHCFLPRILLSPLDGVFCFRLLKFVQTSGTPGFRTLGFYDQLFRESRLTSLMFMCTSKEADNLGRFLVEVLRDLNRWHEKKATYEKEAYGVGRNLPGFATRLATDGKPDTFLNFEDFRRLLYKWHQHLCTALKNCFSSPDYMHVRNAISVLKVVASHYPVVNWMGESLKQLVGELGKSEQGDIKVPSLALMGDLNRRTKSWVMPQAFRKGPGTTEQSNGISRPSSTKPLNAEAPEFQPSTTPATNGDSGTPKANAFQAEDGELRDAEKTADQNGATAQLSQEPIKTEATKPEEEAHKLETEDHGTDQEEKPHRDIEAVKETGSTPVPSSRSTTPQRPIPKRPDPNPSLPPPSTVTHHPSLPNRPEKPPSRMTQSRPEYSDDRKRPEPSLPSRPPDLAMDRRNPRVAERDRPPRHAEHGQSRDGEQTPRLYDRNQERNAYEYSRSEPRDREHLGRSDERYSHHPLSRERDGPRSEYHSQDHRGRPEIDPYQPRGQDRMRENTMPTLRSSAPHSADNPNINPERAAFITANNEMSIKGQGDRPRPQRGTLPRNEEHSMRATRRDEMPGDRRPPLAEPREDYPVGPRHSSERAEYPRHSAPRPREIDMSHGRLNNDDQDPPSGPRTRSAVPGRGRGIATPQPHIDTDVQGSGPSMSTTSHRREPSGADRATRSSSMSEPNNPAPATPTEAASIHPDRLRQLQSPSSESAPMRPPPPQTRSQPPTPSQASPPFAPSGPRGAPPSGPSPTTRGPPSGPQSDSAGRGARGGRHPLAAVNSHLQQANQNGSQDRNQGMSIRGRGGMRNASAPSHSIPASPTNGPGPRSEAFASSSNVPDGRSELFPGRGLPSSTPREPAPPPPPRFDENRGPPPRPGPRGSDDRRNEASSDTGMHASRPAPAGRRGDLIDEASESGRRSSRHSSSSRTEDAEREIARRTHDREDGRRDHDRGPGYFERENRGDYGRERERRPEDHRESRDPSGRSMRSHEMNGPPPTTPQYPPGDRRGYPPGPHHDERELRSRDRDGRELRRSDRDRAAMNENANSITPQKRRGPEEMPEGRGYGNDSRGGRGGMYRNPSESKRPRRGL